MKNKKQRIYKSPEAKKKAHEKTLNYIAGKFKKELQDNETSEEKRVEQALQSLNIKYNFQKVFPNITSFYIVDFYLPEYNVVIEVDGLHHLIPEKKISDSIRDLDLIRIGNVNKVIRILNPETRCSLAELKKKIKKLLND